MTIKQNGGVFGRNPTFNDVTIEGQLTFDGDIDVNSDLTVDGTLKADAVRVGDIAPSYNVLASARNAGGSFEWGHSNSSGYPSTMGAESGSGSPYMAFNAGPGTTSNTYKTLGILGTVIKTDTSGNLRIGRLTDASADNQTPVESAVFTNSGNLAFPSGQGIDFSATSALPGMTSELLDDYEEGVFTPEVADASTGGNQASGGTFSGRYTKIGNRVFCQISLINIATVGMTATNGIFIRALPFTAYSGSNMYSPATILKSAITSTEGTLVGLVNINSTTMSINNDVSGVAGVTGALVSQISSGGGDIYTSFFYETAL